jgi:hypothetical protein
MRAWEQGWESDTSGEGEEEELGVLLAQVQATPREAYGTPRDAPQADNTTPREAYGGGGGGGGGGTPRSPTPKSPQLQRVASDEPAASQSSPVASSSAFAASSAAPSSASASAVGAAKGGAHPHRLTRPADYPSTLGKSQKDSLDSNTRRAVGLLAEGLRAGLLPHLQKKGKGEEALEALKADILKVRAAIAPCAVRSCAAAAAAAAALLSSLFSFLFSLLSALFSLLSSLFSLLSSLFSLLSSLFSRLSSLVSLLSSLFSHLSSLFSRLSSLVSRLPSLTFSLSPPAVPVPPSPPALLLQFGHYDPGAPNTTGTWTNVTDFMPLDFGYDVHNQSQVYAPKTVLTVLTVLILYSLYSLYSLYPLYSPYCRSTPPRRLSTRRKPPRGGAYSSGGYGRRGALHYRGR